MFSPDSLDLRSSRRQQVLLVLGHVGPSIALFASGMPVVANLLLIASLALHLYFQWRKTVSFDHPQALVGLSWGPQGWWAQTSDGRSLPVAPLPALISETLTVLRLRPLDGGRQIQLLLHPDSADPEALRRLRVMLRYGRQNS